MTRYEVPVSITSRSHLIAFDPLGVAGTIPLSIERLAPILDITLRASGRRTGATPLVSAFPHDVHFYLEASAEGSPFAFDLTSGIVNSIRSQLFGLDQAVLRSTFLAAGRQFLQEGARWMPEFFTPDRVRAEDARLSVLAEQNLAQQFQRLGDRGLGMGGSFHPFALCLDQLPLEAIGIGDLIGPELTARTLSMDKLSNVRLTASHGFLRRLDPLSAPTELPGGAVQCEICVVTQHSLSDDFESLQRVLRKDLIEILKRLRTDGIIGTAVRDSQSYLREVTRNMTEIERALGSQQMQFAALQELVKDLKQKVERA